jgi:DNA (cytosine-5)-methyltransferase 1
MITYGSVCSGIEAASVAWEGLGWKAVWFAEIEKFPAAVLAHHYPAIPNLGDMTKIAAGVRAGSIPAPAVMVGGTPCQAFSIAGLRKSLDDPRGQLTLAYVDLANAIDEKRASNGEPPAVHLWENVPGSLSTEDNAFGYFLAGMAGENEAFEPGPEPEPGKHGPGWRWKKSAGKHVAKWPKSGCVIGRQRKLAWRLLDAQYFGVAQRRRRVFVVSSARNDFDPAEVLLEFDGVRRDSPPSRKSPEETTGTITSRASAGGGLGDFELNGGLTVAGPLTACGTGVGGPDFSHAAAGHLISAFGGGNCSGALDVAACLTAKGQRNDFDVETFAVQSATGEVSHTLTAEGYDASEDGSGRGTPTVAYGFQTRIARNGRGDMADVCHALSAESGETGKGDAAPCVARCVEHAAFAENTRGELRLFNGDGQITGALSAGGGKPGQGYPSVVSQCEVRRLTPKECERLQGFPDGWTLIPEKKRNTLAADELAYLRLTHPDMQEDEAHRLAADGPRYKAIGNSMPVPVMRWIGDRIANQIMLVADEIEPQPAALPAPPSAKKKRAPARRIADDKYPRSFLKWAGGKHSVLDEIRAMLPTGDRLIEPFVGSGTVFINAGFKRNLLGDVNPDLINLFNQLQGNPDAVIKTAYQLERGCISGKAHDAIRTEFNGRKAHAVRHAALFLALMRTSYNGLCRYNQKGLFNVGWNKKGEANYFPMDELAHFTGMQKEMTFMCAGFEDVIAQAGEGDIVFCDPPYEPLPDEAGFTAYSGTSFTFADQVRLVECLVAARDRGAKVVITNSSAPAILHLYISNGFRIAPLATRRSVSCKSETRKTVNDIIAAL